MATQTVNYQCPNCMGPLHFSGDTGKLQCDYCGGSYEPAEIEALYQKKEEAAAQAFDQQPEQDAAAQEGGWSEPGMHAYSCPSCGAELVCDETTAATQCPYCGNPSVVPGQFSGMLKPDYILPFKLEKDAAVAALKKYYKGKKFLPKAFSAENHITELQGIYVPFWLYDGSAQGGISMDATTSRTWTEGDYEITETDHYAVHREGHVDFQRIPADGSTKMPDQHMDSIEPFDYSAMEPFSTAYLPGFLAEKYDISAKECAPRVKERMESTLLGLLEDTVTGYTGKTIVGQQIHTGSPTAKYALLPVWMLHTRWKDKDYLFAMNGQTGRLIGDLPVSAGKFLAWLAGISLPLMALATVIMYFYLA